MRKAKEKQVIGWREWVSLPDLQIDAIKVKVDSGARTSALHAEDIEFIKKKGRKRVRFKIYPEQKSKCKEVIAEADLVDQRSVRSSIGHETERPVILTRLRVGDQDWPIELTLVNRDVMGFRMLLGRQAIRDQGFLIDPKKSFLLSWDLSHTKDKTRMSKKRSGTGHS